MKKIRFSVIGAGWRSNFFFKLVKEQPDIFYITTVVIRNPQKAKEVEDTWGFDVVSDIESVKDFGEFVVLALPQKVLPEFIIKCADMGLSVLSETFELENVESLNKLYSSVKNTGLIQIAEQYAFQPMHASRLKLIQSGEIGDVQQAIVSSGHGYHGTSLIRKYLGKTFENCIVKANVFNGKVIKGPGRAGYPEKEELVNEEQVFASLDFGDCLGFYYFTYEQYFSKIRKPNILIRGTHGEIQNDCVRTLIDFKNPIEYSLVREVSGFNESPDAYSLIGITGCKECLYKNRYDRCNFSDDEIAVATVIECMAEYVREGKSFYSFEEGLQDQYLSILMKESIKLGEGVSSSRQLFSH